MHAAEKVQRAASLARRVRRGNSVDERPLIELLHTIKPASMTALMEVITCGGTWEVPRGRIDIIIDTYRAWRQVECAPPRPQRSRLARILG